MSRTLKPSSSIPIMPSAQPQQRAVLGDLSNSHRVQQGVQSGKNLLAGNNNGVHKPLAHQQTQFIPTQQQQTVTSTRAAEAAAAAAQSHQLQMAQLQAQQQAQQAALLAQQQQAALQQIDPMDTTLEENIAEMTISPVSDNTSSSTSLSYSPYILSSVDESDKLNSQMCSEYAQEILEYWRSVEMRRAPNAQYMSRQVDINPKMREILVDWMVEVQLKFKLKQETLYLSIHILDRFLERRAVTRTKLQLVGCTAMLLAAKYEEIYAPEVNDFVCISDKAYTREQILAMEGIILKALSFNLTVPLSLNFLQRYARICGIEYNTDTWFLAMYYTELTLQNYSFLQYSPSQIAASALYLAQSTMQHTSNIWSSTMCDLMSYTPHQLVTCITELYAFIVQNENGSSKYKAVKKKFSKSDFGSVANFTCRNPM